MKFRLLALPVLVACSDATAPKLSIRAESFALQQTLPDSLWWRWSCCGEQSGFPVDSLGVPTLVINGRISYHPSYIANNALLYEDSWEKSGNPIYLRGLRLWVDALLERSDTLEDGAIFPRFDFAFALHGNPAQTLPVGWHSGFTQGLVLALLVRTARVTKEPRYADAADRLFKGLTQTQSRRVAHIDGDGYYWIDEYPLANPDLTLNGFAYATLGLYEYWQWKRTLESEGLLREALTTLRHYGPRFRDPGKTSVYCLAHRLPAPAYHPILIELMHDLNRMTGDKAFSDLADQFASDYP